MQAYKKLYSEAQQDPEGFWLEQASRLDWFTPPKTAANVRKNGMADWFPDGKVNVSHLALDAQINAGRGGQVALYYDSPSPIHKATTPINSSKMKLQYLQAS